MMNKMMKEIVKKKEKDIERMNELLERDVEA